MNLGRKSQNWRLSWPEGGGGYSEMLPWPNVGAGLTLEVITWETASSTEGGGGPVGRGLTVLLMESELKFSSVKADGASLQPRGSGWEEL